MALKPAICTQCGAQIEVDDSHESGICSQCGTAFVTEKVIQQNVNNVNIENATIVQQGYNPYMEEVDKCISLLNDCKYAKAEKELTALIDKYPHKGMARLLCANFQLHVLKNLDSNGKYVYTTRMSWVAYKQQSEFDVAKYEPQSPSDRPPSISLIPPIPGSEGIYSQIFPVMSQEETDRFNDYIENFREELMAFFEVIKNQDEMVERYELACKISQNNEQEKAKKRKKAQIGGLITLGIITAAMITVIILYLCHVI